VARCISMPEPVSLTSTARARRGVQQQDKYKWLQGKGVRCGPPLTFIRRVRYRGPLSHAMDGAAALGRCHSSRSGTPLLLVDHADLLVAPGFDVAKGGRHR